MNKRRELFWTVLAVFMILTPFVVNVYKFTKCDFKSDYKCELIHGIGFIGPPIAFITVYFDTDEK